MSFSITEFHHGRLVVFVVGAGTVCSVLGFIVLRNELEADWKVWLLGGLAVMFILGLADVLTSCVRLDRDTLWIRNNFRHRSVKKRDIVDVSWEKGCPVSVKDSLGTWWNLPPIGDSAVMCKTIRTWLKEVD